MIYLKSLSLCFVFFLSDIFLGIPHICQVDIFVVYGVLNSHNVCIQSNTVDDLKSWVFEKVSPEPLHSLFQK